MEPVKLFENRILHLLVTLCTCQYYFLSHLVLGDGISYWGTGPVLINGLNVANRETGHHRDSGQFPATGFGLCI